MLVLIVSSAVGSNPAGVSPIISAASSRRNEGPEHRRGHGQVSGPFAEPIEPALRDTVHSLRQPSGNQIAPPPR